MAERHNASRSNLYRRSGARSFQARRRLYEKNCGSYRRERRSEGLVWLLAWHYPAKCLLERFLALIRSEFARGLSEALILFLVGRFALPRRGRLRWLCLHWKTGAHPALRRMLFAFDCDLIGLSTVNGAPVRGLNQPSTPGRIILTR